MGPKLKTIGFIAAAVLFWSIVGVLAVDKVVMLRVVNYGHDVRVPDIVEFDSTRAGQVLSDSGFVLVVDGAEFDQEVPAGSVISQNPAAYSVTKEGRRIHVMLSKGPETMRMIDVTGISLRQARIFLKESGLEEGRVLRMYSSKYPRNVVIRQSIPPDSLIPLGAMVDLTVSVK